MKNIFKNNFGIGIDIESIKRFKKVDYIKNDSFLKKIFTKNELDYCYSKENAEQHLAARFAGKEAIVKALNSMGRFHMDYKEIEIINIEKGVPMVKLYNKNLKKLKARISLSHCEDKAIAFAIIMEANQNEEC